MACVRHSTTLVVTLDHIISSRHVVTSFSVVSFRSSIQSMYRIQSLSIQTTEILHNAFDETNLIELLRTRSEWVLDQKRKHEGWTPQTSTQVGKAPTLLWSTLRAVQRPWYDRAPRYHSNVFCNPVDTRSAQRVAQYGRTASPWYTLL